MPTVYTIGYKGRSLAAFMEPMRQAGVDGVIDVRLLNTSHLAGYTKRDTLAYMLPEGFQIAYEHRLELAPSPAIREAYLKDADWAAYEAAFLPLMDERSALAVGREILGRYRAPCLLCAEPTASHCHRRLVAEYWARHLGDLTIIHL